MLDVPLVAEAAREALRVGERSGRSRDGRGGSGPFEALADQPGIAADHLGEPQHVVEADQRVGDDEAALRELAPCVGKRHGGLQRRRVVVADVADDGLAAGLGLREADEAGAAADERVAAEPPALDRLEQEARVAGLSRSLR